MLYYQFDMIGCSKTMSCLLLVLVWVSFFFWEERGQVNFATRDWEIGIDATQATSPSASNFYNLFPPFDSQILLFLIILMETILIIQKKEKQNYG